MSERERLRVECIVRDVVLRLVPELIDRRLDELIEEMEDADEWRAAYAGSERERRVQQ